MGYLNERVAFLKGLAEGLDIKDEGKEGRVLNGIIEVLAEMADAISELENAHQELDEYVENLDEDLSDLEETLFGDDDLDDDDDDLDDEDDDEGFTSADGYVQTVCPHCGGKFFLDQTALEDEELLTCPLCAEPLTQDAEDEK